MHTPPRTMHTHPLWTEFLTHANENITLSQTSFVDGNYLTPASVVLIEKSISLLFVLFLLPPATKLGQGNIFRSVCQQFCSHPGAVHAGRYGQQAGGTHPTEIHTCLYVFSANNGWLYEEFKYLMDGRIVEKIDFIIDTIAIVEMLS